LAPAGPVHGRPLLPGARPDGRAARPHHRSAVGQVGPGRRSGVDPVNAVIDHTNTGLPPDPVTPGETAGVTKPDAGVGRAAALAVLDEFLETFSPSSRPAYRSVAAYFLDWLKPREIALAQATGDLGEGSLAGLDSAPAPWTHSRSLLRRFFDALAAAGAVPANPVYAPGAAPRAPGLEEQFAAFLPVER